MNRLKKGMLELQLLIFQNLMFGSKRVCIKRLRTWETHGL